MINHTVSRSTRRKTRVRSKIKGTTQRPRLSVYRSNQHISAQIINDQKQTTLVSVISQTLKSKEKLTKIEQAGKVGQKIAQLALAKKITKVVFDRGSYQYHGRIKALAESARKGGLKF